MSTGLLPPLKPIPIKERVSVIFIERGEIDMLDRCQTCLVQQAVDSSRAWG